MKRELEINKQTNLGELVTKYPEAGVVMTEYGLHCVGCFFNKHDTIENGAQIHGMSDSEIEEMIDGIKKAVEK